MTDTQPHAFQEVRVHNTLAPPDRVWMRPDRLVLLPKKRIGIELVRVHRPSVVIFDALPRYGVMTADGDLRKDVIRLDGDKDVVGRYLVIRIGGRRVAEGVADVLFAIVKPCI